MKRAALLLLALISFSSRTHAQAWSGILSPVSGPGACNPTLLTSPQACGIDWSTAGVPGGIPSATWAQSGATITATSGDRTATIQAALSACGTNHFVKEGVGTFNITHLNIPSNCELRGSGTLTASGTINNLIGTSGSAYSLGTGGPNFSSPASVTVTSGATAGSSNIVVTSAGSISVGMLLSISELNDLNYVTITTPNGTCTWCDGTGDGGVRSRGQIVLVTAKAGSTITFTPPLYSNYGSVSGTGPVLAYYFTPGAVRAGVSNLQTYSNGTGYSQVYNITACEYCWIKGVFNNYTDGDHIDTYWSYHGEIRDSYFSNAYLHVPGSSDSDVDLTDKSTGMLVENNIFERLHVGVMLEWGAAGNVVGYNYEIGNFDSGSTTVILAFLNFHGAHPQFNLFEGNIGNNFTMDAFWGSSSNNTMYRNNFRATDTLAFPRISGRNVVNWASTILANQQNMGQQIAFTNTNINSIGNINGSTDAITVTTNGKYNSGTPPFTSTISPAATRTYDKFFSAISIGYNTGSDTNGSGVASFSGGPGPAVGYWVGKGRTTLFQHGNFDIASNSVIWNATTTHTLPPSFYKGAKPTWFGSVPWPAIGSDVTGGNVDATTLLGHVNAIPALVCYQGEARDTNGIKLFDPNACYNTASSGPIITTTSFPGATQSGAYSVTLTATGGTLPYTWARVGGGSFPTGLSLNASTGVLSGTVTGGAGTSSFSIQVTDFASLSQTQPFNIVVAAAPSVTTASLPAATINLPYSTTLVATNGTLPYTWAVTVGTLPTGLTLATSTGNISGTPTVAGTSSFMVRVTDVNSVVATKALSITVNAPPVVVQTSLPNATQSSAYSTTLTATGGTVPYVWSISVGALPIGLSINSSTGAITGTPSVASTVSFTARVTDANSLFTDQPLSIIVNPAPAVTVLTSSLPNGNVNIFYGQTLTASQGSTPYTWSIIVGTLPAGLSLNATSGFISGTPTTSGVSSFTVKVVDINNSFDTKPLSITIPVVTNTIGIPTHLP